MGDLIISNQVKLSESEIQITAVRAQGPGGQHVNKASTAVQLRFDIEASSLPDYYKKRLAGLSDSRIGRDGVVVIKAQRFRSQLQNREDALDRLQQLLQSVKSVPRKRVPTRPPRQANRKRLEHKSKRGRLKRLRRNPLVAED